MASIVLLSAIFAATMATTGTRTTPSASLHHIAVHYTDLCAPTTCLLCCVLRLFCCLVLPLRVPCTPFCAPCVGVFRFYVHSCVLCYALLCCLLRASCVLCCCVLPLRASCLARGPVAQCADQVTLPELSNHLSHSRATCRELQLNLKSSNMCKVADVQSWRKCRSSQGLK